MILRFRAALLALALAFVFSSIQAGGVVASGTDEPILLAQQAPAGNTGDTSGGAQVPKTDVQKLKAFCDKHPDECKVRAAMIKEWCGKHPDECKLKIAELKVWCERNPGQCRG